MFSNQIKILLADDDEDDCLLFKEVLDELHVKCAFVAVNDGVRLMELLNGLIDKDQELPNALFLDLNMPRKNGYTCLEEIKTNPRLKDLPVIIYSTSMSRSSVDQLYRQGAKYFICKPLDFKILKMVIEHSISLIMNNQTTQPSKDGFLLCDSKSILF